MRKRAGAFSRCDANHTFWQQELSGIDHDSLFFKKIKGSVIGGGEREKVSIQIKSEFLDRIKRFALDNKTTLHSVGLACFYLTLHQYSQFDDIVIGVGKSNRDSGKDERLVGPLKSYVPMRIKIGEELTFSELIKRVNEKYFSLLQYGDVPYDAQDDAASNVFFNYIRHYDLLAEDEKVRLSIDKPLTDVIEHGLVLNVIDGYDYVTFQLSFDLDVLSSEEANNLINSFSGILEKFDENADELSDMDARETQSLDVLDVSHVTSTVSSTSNKELPLGYTQLDHWLPYFYEGDASIIDVRVEIEGVVNRDILQKALNIVVQSHDAFWVTFSRYVPVQRFVEPSTVGFDYYDLSSEDQNDIDQKINKIAQEKSLNFNVAPIITSALVKTGESNYVMIFKFSHIVIDGTSISIFLNDLLYEHSRLTGNSNLPSRPDSMTMKRFIQEERSNQHGEALKQSIKYWKKQAKDMTFYFVPVDTFASARENLPPVSVVTKEHGYQKIRSHSDKLGVTVKMYLLSVLVISLNRFNRQNKLTIKSNYNNRYESSMESLIGNIYKEIIFNVEVSENDAFEDVVKKVRTTVLGAFSHENCPWIIPVALFERRRWPFIFAPFWYAADMLSLLLNKTLFKGADMYPKLISYYLSYLEVPFQKKWQKLIQKLFVKKSKRKTGITIGVNNLLEMEERVDGADIDGLRIKSIDKQGQDNLDHELWIDETLYFEFSKTENGAVQVTLTGGGINCEARQELLELYKDVLEEQGV